MPIFTFTKGDTTEQTIDELINRIKWLTSKLDSKNVKRLDTNETMIKSSDGTTYINGPVLEQSDSAGTLRLKQGYDSSSGNFVYALFNEAGAQTVGVDSNGDAMFTGAITGSTITGGTVTSGTTITVGTDITVGSTLTMQSDALDGIYFKDNSGGSVFGESSITRGFGDSLLLNNDFNPIELTSLDSVYIRGGNASVEFASSASFKYIASDRITYGAIGGTLSSTWYYGSSEIATQSYVNNTCIEETSGSPETNINIAATSTGIVIRSGSTVLGSIAYV